MDRLKVVCWGINHGLLPQELCYTKKNASRDETAKRYASARITPVQIGKKEFDILSVAMYEPESKWSGSSNIYDLHLKREYSKILYFAGEDFLYKDKDGTMRIDDVGGYYWKNVNWLDGESLVQEYFDSELSGAKLAQYLASESTRRRNARIMKKHKKETDAIDAYMDLVPEFPKDLDSFIRNVVTQDSRYIYYKKGRDGEAYCTFCRKDVSLDNKKAYHNTPGRCPSCGKKITYKAKGKSTLVSDEYSFSVIQNTAKGLVARYFKLSIEFKDHYRKPEVHYFEVQRNFIDERKYFEWDTFKQRETRWCKSEGKWNYWRSAAWLYTRNLRTVLRGTQYQYSALYQFATACRKRFDIEKYLEEYRSFNGLEYLVKLKLINLSAAIAQGMHGGVNKYGKGPLEIMCLPKDKINQAIRLNVNADLHRCMVALNKKGMSLEDKDLRWYRDNCKGYDSLADALQYTTFHKLKRYLVEQHPVYEAESRAKDELEALEAQTRGSWYRPREQEYNMASLFRYFIDYVKMSEKVGRDLCNLQVLFPKSLIEAHDDIVEVCRAIEREEQLQRDQERRKREAEKRKQEVPAVKKVVKAYAHLEFKDKNFLIKLPKGVREIVAEGSALSHCVGSSNYISKMAEGRTLILFLRKVSEPDTSYYTIEFDPEKKEILQCRGKSNCSKTKEVEDFVNKYIRKISQMNAASPDVKQKVAG